MKGAHSLIKKDMPVYACKLNALHAAVTDSSNVDRKYNTGTHKDKRAKGIWEKKDFESEVKRKGSRNRKRVHTHIVVNP